MNEREKEYFRMMNENKLEMNDTFEFGCSQCGDCCRNREDILLSPADLFHIAGYLEMSISDLVKKYCEVYEGSNSHLPMVRALPKIHNRVCPFLRKGKCSIHPVKPTVCGLFPLGRAMNQKGEITYFLQDSSCVNCTKNKVTVSDWLREFHIDESEECFRIWHEILIPGTKLFGKLKKDESIFRLMSYWFFKFFYLEYELDEEFIPQFTEKKLLLDGLVQTMSLKKIRHMIEEAK